MGHEREDPLFKYEMIVVGMNWYGVYAQQFQQISATVITDSHLTWT